MQSPPLIPALGRLFALVSILAGLLLLAGAGRVAAEGNEQPDNVVAFPNAPGAITVTWNHSGEGVFWFVIEQESPFAFTTADADKRAWTIVGLAPSTEYRYRVCAVFDTNRVCSDEDGVGYASVRTLPPEGQQNPSRPPAPRIVSHEAGDTWLRICWLADFDYDSYFVNSEEKGVPGTLRTIDHENGGGQGCQRVDGLQSGRTYILGVQGCSETWFGIGSDRCHDWSAGYEVSTVGLDLVVLESVNHPGRFIRHRNALGELTPVASGLDHADATWVQRPALNGAPGAVSFESTNYPGTFLRHQDFRIKQQRDDGSDLFKQDASFMVRPGLAGGDAQSFEAVNEPGHFLRHANWELWIARNDGSELFKQDASFRRQPPSALRLLLPGDGASFESANVPGHFLRHRLFLADLTRIESDLDRADATFYIRPALNGAPGAVSFEAVTVPGNFLRHEGFRLKLAGNDGSDLFKQDASFIRRPALNGAADAVSFEAVNVPGHFLRHANYQFWLAGDDGSDLFKQDASFYQRGPR